MLTIAGKLFRPDGMGAGMERLKKAYFHFSGSMVVMILVADRVFDKG
jgi:hypothetical protein